MITRLILAALAGSVTQFLLGWLVYGFLLANFMSSQTTHYEGLMKDMGTGSFFILVYLSGLVMSFLLAFIFQRWAKFDRFVQGLCGGLLFGFLYSLSADLYSISMMNLLTVNAMLVDVVAGTCTFGILGGVITCVLGYKLEKKAQ